MLSLRSYRKVLVWLSAVLCCVSSGRVHAANPDWLLDPSSYTAAVTSTKSEVVLQNGLVRRTFRLNPNAATVALDQLVTGSSLLRAVEPEGLLTVDGLELRIGGLRGQTDHAYLLPEWLAGLTNDPASFQFTGVSMGSPEAPIAWTSKRHHADLPWPPPGMTVDLHFRGPEGPYHDLVVVAHHELYDGLPIFGKWLTISNGTTRTIILDRFAVERLAIVEAESAVDERPKIAWRTPAIDVLSDYMFKGMDVVTGNQTATWQPDPAYTTQVSYAFHTPCILQIQPPVGPGKLLAPGESFTTFRSYIILHDSTDRERQGLTLRHALRALAPWTSESPVMMHVRSAETKAFRQAVDQCLEVGFEMIIYTFGSGLDMENQDSTYLSRVKADVDYAHARGLEVGAYSLFSSRSIDPTNDVINPSTGKPGGAIFGNAPCFASVWGQNYFRKLTNFIAQTGLDLLEHDGPYPGDVCASTNHPGHHGLADSQWANWDMNSRLYMWCRARGVYVNQPDYYFLSGGNKTGMGYREDNFSLPRERQLIHSRQNIYDGTWTKPQTAGWMFVPLTEYQGGGATATIEPLAEHLPAYEGHLANTLGAGVQACWRGPRLYDSEPTKLLVEKWVTWFKKYRDILESDIIHGRRADGRDIDYLVHVNPRLPIRAFSMIHNPLKTAVEREVTLPLYYSGLSTAGLVKIEEGSAQKVPIERDGRMTIRLRIPAEGRTWLTVEPVNGPSK